MDSIGVRCCSLRRHRGALMGVDHCPGACQPPSVCVHRFAVARARSSRLRRAPGRARLRYESQALRCSSSCWRQIDLVPITLTSQRLFWIVVDQSCFTQPAAAASPHTARCAESATPAPARFPRVRDTQRYMRRLHLPRTADDDARARYVVRLADASPATAATCRHCSACTLHEAATALQHRHQPRLLSGCVEKTAMPNTGDPLRPPATVGPFPSGVDELVAAVHSQLRAAILPSPTTVRHPRRVAIVPALSDRRTTFPIASSPLPSALVRFACTAHGCFSCCTLSGA
jgi:hypothetical protein